MAVKELKGIIDDGTREIPLENKFGKLICKIYIRPADISILDRYQQLTSDFKEIVEPLKEIDINNDGTVAFDHDWQIMKKVEDELKKRINALFDMDEADEIFATRNPFSSVHGKFFCESVIEGIGAIIATAVEEEAKLSRKRTEKYLKDIQASTTGVSGDDRTAAADA